ncbi:RNA-directed DNA polymerase [Niallia sp. BSM11]|uniref:RNA-directed DNA polymerase n=1 Tax=Niallia sp. BSM11 TaxID=3391576 RepID=UPI0039851A9A
MSSDFFDFGDWDFLESPEGLSLENLIRGGYLPYEIIPPINTNDYADNISYISSKVQSFKGEKYSKYCTYTIPKVKHVRRLLAIPNPYHQLKLSQLIVDNWEEIEVHIENSPISLSKPVINNLKINSNREIRTFSRKINLSDISKESILHSTDARYLLKTDISRFYPTIYTHIIPWALHSKDTAKSSLKDRTLFKNLSGNKIDEATRSTQENQTIGIPIGPDTSLVIAEIIGAAIDKYLYQKLKEKKIKLQGFRFVDDFYLYFKTFNDAQFALSALHHIMKDFELELSPEKTKIIELPVILEPKWTIELRRLQNKNINKLSLSDDEIITYFSRAFELSKEYPDESVLKYALTEIAEMQISKEQWKIYESLVLNSMIVEPSVLPIATEILLGYRIAKYPLDFKKIKLTLFEIILYYCSYGYTHEISWALWLCKSLNINIPVKVAKELAKIEDSIVALITLDLHNQGKIKKIDVSLWESLVTKESLYSNHWLLTYEAINKGWLNPKEGRAIIEDDDFFKLLLEKNISFYKPDEQVLPVEVNLSDNEKLQRRKTRRRKRLY